MTRIRLRVEQTKATKFVAMTLRSETFGISAARAAKEGLGCVMAFWFSVPVLLVVIVEMMNRSIDLVGLNLGCSCPVGR
jgi:hypothetical protein